MVAPPMQNDLPATLSLNGSVRQMQTTTPMAIVGGSLAQSEPRGGRKVSASVELDEVLEDGVVVAAAGVEVGGAGKLSRAIVADHEGVSRFPVPPFALDEDLGDGDQVCVDHRSCLVLLAVDGDVDHRTDGTDGQKRRHDLERLEIRSCLLELDAFLRGRIHENSRAAGGHWVIFLCKKPDKAI